MTGIRATWTSHLEDATSGIEARQGVCEKATLLVVDDERGPRESLRMILSPRHRVLVAEDGAQALTMLAQHRIDAITVDLNMPGMKGDELVRRVRAAYPQIEVIVITGYSSVETAVDGLRLGIFDYLTKPFDVVQVGETVRRALARRDERHRLVDLLRGIRAVADRDQNTDEDASAEASGPLLQQRLHAMIDQAADGPLGATVCSSRLSAHELLERLSTAVEAREPGRAGHARRVAFLAGLIAEQMGLRPERREEIRVASLLHDLGRIALPSREAGQAATREDVALHATAGADLARAIGYAKPVTDAIEHHHARWGASCEQSALEGNAIPLSARIIAVADAFDRLTHTESGCSRCTPAEAVAMLGERAGRDLDPDAVKALISIAEARAIHGTPLLGMCFGDGEDPTDTIASATAWLETD